MKISIADLLSLAAQIKEVIDLLAKIFGGQPAPLTPADIHAQLLSLGLSPPQELHTALGIGGIDLATIKEWIDFLKTLDLSGLKDLATKLKEIISILKDLYTTWHGVSPVPAPGTPPVVGGGETI